MSDSEPPPENSQPPVAPTRPLPKRDTLVDLHSGKGFRIAESEQVSKAEFSTVILLAGTAKCGKTTLLSSLLLLFQKGVFADYLFGGSRTLVGFEERNFHVGIESGLHEPTMERTKFTELLHVRVRQSGLKEKPQNLLLCDLSGEDFREAKDSLDACKKLEIIRRADRFVLLVDGAKLANYEERQTAKNDAITLLRSCLDAKMISDGTPIDVLITKWDYIESSENRADTETFADHVEEAISQQFSSRVSQIRTYRVAAHPHDPEKPLGFGLDGVFKSWLTVHAAPKVGVLNIGPADVRTEYDRFLWHNQDDVGATAK